MLAQVGETELAISSTGVRPRVTPVGSDTHLTGQVWQVSPIIDAAEPPGHGADRLVL